MTTTKIAGTADTLRELFPIGSTVQTKLLHVSRSGMLRSIAVLVPTEGGGIRDVSYLVAEVTGSKIHEATGGMKVTGCGMDMGFALAYSLARALYSDQGTAAALASLQAKRDQGETFEPYEKKRLRELEADTRPPFLCTGDSYMPRNGERINPCPSNDHTNDHVSDYRTTRVHSDGGYALNHRWI